MNFYSLRPVSLVKRLACIAVAATGLAGAAPSWAEDFFKPGQVYGGVNLSVLEAGYECTGSPTCDRTRVGTKLFGGYNYTPNLAVEVSYYYLGSFQSVQGGNNSSIPAGRPIDTKLRNAGVSFALNWHNELFQVLEQHIRFGLAIVRTDGRIVTSNGTNTPSIENVREYTTKPYLGLGLSYQMTKNLRFYQGYDVLRNKRNNHIHVLSMGLGLEN